MYGGAYGGAHVRMVCQGCGVRSLSYPTIELCYRACIAAGWLIAIPRVAHFCPSCGDEFDDTERAAMAQRYAARIAKLRRQARDIGQALFHTFIESWGT